ncbi:hypothetical protein FB45DRAFT_1058820 [Roridomyces roridus]|uniref:T6SS Phospholipase effector Tle1-like catalytic domain-containing protein n=1 Tax=Roridomyces roridus TaxID=1738132 RepID=A0AAD7FNU8_9AGAR|nr:hypothetical protein FB45DRAFT_1058820 [Roridomyces roridus]
MAVLEFLLLRILHWLYCFIALVNAYWNRFLWSPPLPLEAPRRRIPQHLALLLVPVSSSPGLCVETVSRTAAWCRVVGIEKLTVFDSHGVLVDCADQIQQSVAGACGLDEYDSSSDIEYPITPPPSDYSESRPRSPENDSQKETSVITFRFPEIKPKPKPSRFGLKRRQQRTLDAPTAPLTLCIASRQCSKPAIAAAATQLARRRQLDLSIESLNTLLEGPHALAPPDFLIVHHLCPSNVMPRPLELYGFPPWQIRLTEIYNNSKRRSLRQWLTLGKTPPIPDSTNGPNQAPFTRVKKRIIVCCDGTWEDGVSQENRQSYTNILRLARTINHEDARFQPPIPQIVFYQSGIGSEKTLYSQYVVGITGDSLGDKVEEAYAFIAHNYQPGDEIFLFGFSRGAYTARMVAMFIGEIGVLDRTDMDHFATIFLAYQKLGKSKDAAETQQLKAEMAPWTSSNSPGKRRADSDQDTFSIKFVGVFETVGSGSYLSILITTNPTLLSREHIQYAYHALALDENRVDFTPCKFEQTPHGLQKGQVLSQCWFSGSHADVGGGWKEHDLADISLFWMAANVGDHLSLDYAYLGSLPNPSAAWGALPPHNPDKGLYTLAKLQPRAPPTEKNNVTHETIHLSVTQRKSATPVLKEDLQVHSSSIIAPLLALEDGLRSHWHSLGPGAQDHSAPSAKHAAAKEELQTDSVGKHAREKHWLSHIVKDIKHAVEKLP